MQVQVAYTNYRTKTCVVLNTCLVVFNTTSHKVPPYEPLGPPMRAPRMWGVERDIGASMGRRGMRGDGLVVVFWASLVMAVESAVRRRVGTRWGEGVERLGATRLYDLPCPPMGVPRVWAIKRDLRLPLG